MTTTLGKAIALAVLVLVLGSVLVVMTQSSRERARFRYCQNNARELGRLGANEVFRGPGLPEESVGRQFWYEIRVITYRNDTYRGEPDPSRESPEECRTHPCPDDNHRHVWKAALVDTHLFLCPVYGKTKFAPDDPNSIDYRGPREIPDLYQKEGRVILGADRDENHPGGGGFVIFADSSVADRQSESESAADGSSLWEKAAQSLRD